MLDGNIIIMMNTGSHNSVDQNQRQSLSDIDNDDPFQSQINSKYPFNKHWLFQNDSLNLSFVNKLKFPHPIIDNFERKYPFFNPSIINVENLKNYTNFILSSIKPEPSKMQKEIIQNTKFILIGRWKVHQCHRSQFFSYHFRAPLLTPILD